MTKKMKEMQCDRDSNTVFLFCMVTPQWILPSCEQQLSFVVSFSPVLDHTFCGMSLTHTCRGSMKDVLTKRLELLFRTVLALPKASSRGFDCRMMSFTCYGEHSDTANSRHNVKACTETWDITWVIACCRYLNFRSSSRHFGNVTHDVFGSHCLPSTTFTTVITPR